MTTFHIAFSFVYSRVLSAFAPSELRRTLDLRLRPSLKELGLSSNSPMGMTGFDSVNLRSDYSGPGSHECPIPIDANLIAESNFMAQVRKIANSVKLPALEPVLA